MSTTEIIALISILSGPLVAIWVSIWYHNRKEKRQQKLNSFLSLAMYRDHRTLNSHFVSNLNTIDIVFHDCPKVLAAWKKYYEHLHSVPPENASENDLTALRHLKVELLQDIAEHLGYKNLRTTDIEKYYFPNRLQNQQIMSLEIQIELLNYLKKANRFYDSIEAGRFQSSDTPIEKESKSNENQSKRKTN